MIRIGLVGFGYWGPNISRAAEGTGVLSVEMIADAVGIGSGVYGGGIELFGEINRDLAAFLKARGFESLAQVKGMAHGEERS